MKPREGLMTPGGEVPQKDTFFLGVGRSSASEGSNILFVGDHMTKAPLTQIDTRSQCFMKIPVASSQKYMLIKLRNR